MKSKIIKILGVVLSLALLSSMAIIAIPVSAAGDPDIINAWETMTTPSGVDADVEIITQAEDGTIFISVYDEVGGNWDMYKSADGYAWVPTCIMNQDTAITAIECSDDYTADETVYVAIDTSDPDANPATYDGHTTIYRCTGTAASGVTPGTLGQISAGEHGTANASYVYSIDSNYDGADVWLLVATDIDVYAIPDDNGLTTVWTDMDLSETLGGGTGAGDGYADGPGDISMYPGVEVFKAMFAPDFDSTGVIWAVYYDEFTDVSLTNTAATYGYGLIARSSGSTLWGTVITPVIVFDVGSGDQARSHCDVEFADDYSSDPLMGSANLYAALSFRFSGLTDDIYSIECDFYGNPASVTPFSVNGGGIDFCSLEVSGNLLIAGVYDYGLTTTEVWVSLNNGITWNMATKNPTGESSYTCNLLISTAGSSAGAFFAGTGGDQSALSISEDDGDTWNQIAFIDNDIDSIDDMAFDPTSTSAAMITQDTGDGTWSLWKTDDVTTAAPPWQRTLCTGYSTTIVQFDLVEYSMDGTVAMLYDDSVDRIYRSSDDLQTFVNWKSTAAWGTINRWVIYDSSSVYAACSASAPGLGGFWSTAVVGSDLTGVNLRSIAIQTGFDPDDADNSVLVVGDNSGNVYVSFDAGDNLEAPVSVDATSNPVYVAFDNDNNLYIAEGDDVYIAAIGATNIVVSAAVIGGAREPFSDPWITDIDVSADNTLYVLSEDADVARYLIDDVNYEGRESRWDIAWNFGGPTSELWITSGSNTAWTIDFGNVQVNLLDDTLTGQVTGITFSDVGPFSFTVSWDEMEGATDYQVRIYLEGDTDDWLTTFIDDNVLDLADYYGATYILTPATDWIVEVRVNNGVEYYSDDTWMYPYPIGQEIEKSRWSAAADVMTDYYMTMPIPTNPSQGADEVSLTPSFGWSAVNYAVTYKIQLSDDPEFDSLIDSVSVTTTAYSYVGDGLDYDSDYYWRVQAVAPNGTTSEWSTYTETYFAITLPDDLIYSIFWSMGPVDGLFDWVSGAISNFHTEEEEFAPVTVEPAPTPTIILPTPVVNVNIPEITIPDITVNPPAVTVNLPTPTVTSVTNLIDMPDQDTPVYIWLIVAIGALLTIAVIVLIIRTRRVV